MNDNDQLLISAYLDNELNAQEQEYVEDLLKKDNAALEYLNAMKEVDNSMKSFINSSLNSDEAIELRNFAKALSSKKSKNPENYFSNLLKAFFVPQAVFGYALSGLIFFNLGTGNFASNGMDEFSYSNPTQYTHLKLRGIDNKNLLIEKTLNLIIAEKKGNANLTYGSEEIFVEVIDMLLNEESFKCFKGKVTIDRQIDKFIFCKSNSSEESFLLFE